VTVHKSNPRAARLPSSLLAILMLGACGSSGSEPAAKDQGSPSVTLELPAPEPYRKVSIPEAPPPSAQDDAAAAAENATAAAPTEKPQAVPAETKPAEKAPEKKAAEKKADDKERSTASATAATVEEKSAAKAERNKSDTDAVPTRSGRPPLGDAEIARTIDRIGFPCGRVVSSEAVASGQGIYKINCSSGEAYQGTTKGGHLFFRPWTGKLERD
jgi:outer membrane biosynthesis protein TonB